MEPGRRRISVSAPNFVAAQETVTIEEGETVNRRLRLARMATPATARFSANPGTELYIDGERIGAIPPVIERELAAGSHAIRYVMPGYAEHEETIQLSSGEAREFSHQFPVPGALRIMAQPYAQVLLDGKDMGFTPVTVEKVSEGEHTIVLQREGFQTLERTITVKPYEINRFQYKMVRQ